MIPGKPIESLRAMPSDIPQELVFGQTPSMRTLRERAIKVAQTDIPVLILGESGTGKEVLAKMIHSRSSRSAGPFLKLNCPAIPGALLESELFGYEEGAFTGAYRSKPGLVDMAAGGTLFLDEIGEMPTEVQAKLLRLLQDGSYAPIGGRKEKRANIRVMSATNRSLEREIQLGTFRQDLLYRINVVSFEMPPLCNRRADIPLLVDYFVERYQEQYGCQVTSISSDLMQLLIRYEWPGNVRELENLIRRYVVLGSEEVIAAELLGPEDNSGRFKDAGIRSLKALTREAVRELERKIILQVLHANNWNRKAAAKALQISYRALFYKLKNSGVPGKRMTTAKRQTSAAE